MSAVREIKLRAYQSSAIQQLRDGIADGLRRQVLVAPTGAGKTVMALSLVDGVQKKGRRAWFIVDRVTLVKQTSDRFAEYGIDHGIIQGNNHLTDYSKPVQIVSAQTLARRDISFRPDLIIHDECFPGDVEVLTSAGFLRFEELSGDEIFAQYDMPTEAITFTKASRLVRRPCAGDLFHLKSERRIDIRATGGHDLIVEVGGARRKVRVDRYNPGDKALPVAGFARGPDAVLTPRERFLIAFQADGSLHYEKGDAEAIAAFSFSKRRKTEELLRVCEDAGYEVTEVAPQSNGSPNAKPRRRFMVRLPFVPTKDVRRYFDLHALSAQKARAIITAMNGWDGHVSAQNSSYWVFTTTDKDAADFYQAVCTLGGMRSTLSMVSDDRSAAFSDVYRLHIQTESSKIGGQGFRPKPVPFDGDVFCVSVPTGCIIVRSGGKVLVVGNCHAQFDAVTRLIERCESAKVVGLTATPFTAGMAGQWDGLVNSTTANRLIEQGALVPLKIKACVAPDMAGVPIVAGEYEQEEAGSRGTVIIGDVVTTWIEQTRRHFGGPVKTLLFSPSVKHGEEVCRQFAEAGYNFQQLSYHNDEDEKDDIIREFRRPDSAIHGLVSCAVLTKGFDVPDVLCGISCRPYRKSLSSHVQEMGRIMRPHEGKSFGLWICHSNNVISFAQDVANLNEYGVESLSDAAKQDSKPREPSEKVRKEMFCGDCAEQMPPKTACCPTCGWERPARGETLVVPGVAQDFDPSLASVVRPRAGLRAPCLNDSRRMWNACLAFCLTQGSAKKTGDEHRRRAKAMWHRIYPDAQMPSGAFKQACDFNGVTPSEWGVVEREAKSHWKKAGKGGAMARPAKTYKQEGMTL